MSNTKDLHGTMYVPPRNKGVGGKKLAYVEHGMCGKIGVGNCHESRQLVGQMGP